MSGNCDININVAVATNLHVHPMGALFYLSLLASHEPVHWTIKCDGYKELVAEVRQDQYLDDVSKRDLINYFATKVEEECNDIGRK